jgi:sulfur relay (sulfurtransferase) DsrF/TusC family protein
MSSFLIEDSSINKIVTFLIKCSYSNEIYYGEINKILVKYGFNLNYIENKNLEAEKLARYMKSLNLSAINYRYNEENKDYNIKFEEIDEKNLFQILKSLECFLYQCSEGEIPQENLFKMLEQITYILKDLIINSLKDYKTAKWH